MNIEDLKEGQSIKYIIKRTKYYLVYEPDMEWYRCERETCKSLEYSYIMYKDVNTQYSLRSYEAGVVPEIIEINEDEVHDRNMKLRGITYKVK